MKKFLILVFLIFLDLFVKNLVFNSIYLNNFIPITSFFDLAHIHNYGISFGLFSGFFTSWVIVVISSLVTLFIFYLYFQSNNILEKWAYFVIIAGALSNIIDRGINGYVLDYLYFHYKEFYWPAFNFADIYISLGVFMIIIKLFKDFNNKRNK